MSKLCPKDGPGKKKTKNEKLWQRNEKKHHERKNRPHKVDPEALEEEEVMNFRCKCRFQSCIDKIGGTVQAHSIREKFDAIRKTVTSGDFSFHERQHLAQYVILASESPNRAQYTYLLPAAGDSKKIPVCKATWAVVFGIGKNRIRKLTDPETGAIGPQPSRTGKQPSGNCTKISVTNAIRAHIKSFPARESHYSRSKNKEVKYLDSELSIKKLYKLFCGENPSLHVSENTYRHVFNTKFNVKFGWPRSDICETCDMFNAQVKAAQLSSDTETEQKILTDMKLHQARGDAWAKRLREVRETIKDEKHGAFAFDFQKNLPLPLTNIGPEYYKRQLWIHNFDIHDLGSGTGTMFLYSEHFAKKGASDVISCLDYYISNFVADSVEHLHLFADNCFGQNKNKYMVAFLHALVLLGRFASVTLQFPIPGHSWMPCDSDFGKIEKKRRRKEKVLVPSAWVTTVQEAQENPPFQVVFVEHPLTDDLQLTDVPVCIVKNFKAALDPVIEGVPAITQIRQFKFVPEGIFTTTSMTGNPNQEINMLKTEDDQENFLDCLAETRLAYTNFLPIKKEKLADVKYWLSSVVLGEHVTFYDSLKSADTGDSSDEEDVE